MPAPLCVDQSMGLLAHNNEESENDFVGLLLRMRINDYSLRKGQEVPFDTCCPSVQELIPSRTCKNCSLYHSSVKNLKAHQKICRRAKAVSSESVAVSTSTLNSRRIQRPVRVAAQRQREKMVIWTTRLNDYHVDWFDQDEVESVEIIWTDSNISDSDIPYVDLSSHLEVVWENCD